MKVFTKLAAVVSVPLCVSLAAAPAAVGQVADEPARTEPALNVLLEAYDELHEYHPSTLEARRELVAAVARGTGVRLAYNIGVFDEVCLIAVPNKKLVSRGASVVFHDMQYGTGTAFIKGGTPRKKWEAKLDKIGSACAGTVSNDGDPSPDTEAAKDVINSIVSTLYSEYLFGDTPYPTEPTADLLPRGVSADDIKQWTVSTDEANYSSVSFCYQGDDFAARFSDFDGYNQSITLYSTCENAQDVAVLKAHITGLLAAVELYKARNNSFPEELSDLIADGYVAPDGVEIGEYETTAFFGQVNSVCLSIPDKEDMRAVRLINARIGGKMYPIWDRPYAC